MNCVRCPGVALLVRHYEQVEIDQCPQCHGLWLDDGEIAHIVEIEQEKFDHELVVKAVEAAFTGVPSHEIESKESCPKCQAQLMAINFAYDSGVIVDRCPKGHGIWFDGSELDQVQARHEHWNHQVGKDKKAWLETLSAVQTQTMAEFAQLKADTEKVPSRYLLNRTLAVIMRWMI
jgi:Zn-finger nucleic acid-binding protein